jgi:hypothetical protein
MTYRRHNSAVLPRAGRPVNHKILKLISAAETRNTEASDRSDTDDNARQICLTENDQAVDFSQGSSTVRLVIRS